MNIKLRYSGLIEDDCTNGIGVCVSFWTQGCPHHCEGCHNKQTWDYSGGYELPSNYIEYVWNSLHKFNVKRNLSILGGEPLCDQNYKIVYDLLKAIKLQDSSIKVFLWTGYTYEDLLDSYKKDILDFIDILIDGKFELSKRDLTLWLKGSSNQRVIDLNKIRSDYSNVDLGILNNIHKVG